ncbi:hypothetical protein ACE5M2_19205 [Clostridioides difficile]
MDVLITELFNEFFRSGFFYGAVVGFSVYIISIAINFVYKLFSNIDKSL